MGEVYRAKDGKLGRDVAIKVLPEEFVGNEERLARFKREAKVLASLNHQTLLPSTVSSSRGGRFRHAGGGPARRAGVGRLANGARGTSVMCAWRWTTTSA